MFSKCYSLFVRAHCQQVIGGLSLTEWSAWEETHRLALQRLWGDGLRRDAACNRSAVSWVPVLWGREEKAMHQTEGEFQRFLTATDEHP